MTDQARKVLNILLALVVSMGAWIFVVYNYEPMTNVRYGGIPVTYTGLQTLANRGYAVTEQERAMVDVTLQQRRVDTGNISAEDISVTADVSNLATGENTVVLSVKAPDGTSVSDTSIKTVTIDIESADSVDMDISFEYSGAPEENDVPVVEEASVQVATVIATEAKLAEIDRVAAVIDPDELGSRLRALTLPLVALDKDGNRVLNVVIEPETVSFRAMAGVKRNVRLIVPVKDESGDSDSYERTYTAPETVEIRGSRTAVNATGSLSADEVNISYLYEDTEIPLEFTLPDGIYLGDNGDLVLKVKVREKPDEEKTDE